MGFEEKFAQRKTIKVLDAELETVDVKPDFLKTETPVLFAPGWGGTPEAYKDPIKTLYEKNRRVLSLAHARKGADEELMDSELKKQYLADELRKALALLSLIDKGDIEKVDAIAHSEGAINTAIAASLHPDKFRNIVFVNPAGLIGPDKFPKLAGRFNLNGIQTFFGAIFGKEELKRNRLQRLTKEVIKYIGQNPARALKESVAISQSEIYAMLEDLHEKGIGIFIINGVGDPVFPMDKMQKILKADKIDGFLSVKGGHNEIISNPEKYAAAADELLENAENKKEKIK
ncbi:MAG: hypothetical protein UW93_C0009G0030 [Parcubacteria group bacterium GW2011_GWC1_45_13]|uniref:AB hydrolase-1 domain-containing protein n=2 Tax=Patescibacteria group TaxID=1783273 RepID=A0A0G1IWR9_9BACT|nr:MAG: hypothetical protein UW57_C0006G0037 [Candidatus Giovannonibacteria bacterium GW2011_GWA1_44_29]KKT91299.1 MAG: hypothetical protein UW93_C0009G0030 [Parcubacteria group bacterium GW2011_GWC1_45_13]KKU29821.1 MAG: hypothetical protein UX43_C0005G0029 [Candidatus Giovannonibacteria bacterium GW2011_GWB1_46_20]KKU82798.1 MAG: hypothetical protein UY11_C0038G0001 [Candidatus Amesbacteria bacterium GW2011_GWC2_47_8]